MYSFLGCCFIGSALQTFLFSSDSLLLLQLPGLLRSIPTRFLRQAILGTLGLCLS
jgi:hypothetical protein